MGKKVKTPHYFSSYVRHLDFPVLFTWGLHSKNWTKATAAWGVVAAPTAQRGSWRCLIGSQQGNKTQRQRRERKSSSSDDGTVSVLRSGRHHQCWAALLWFLGPLYCILHNQQQLQVQSKRWRTCWADELSEHQCTFYKSSEQKRAEYVLLQEWRSVGFKYRLKSPMSFSNSCQGGTWQHRRLPPAAKPVLKQANVALRSIAGSNEARSGRYYRL